MIISKTADVKLNSKNITYFESLGYSIPKYLDKNNKNRVKHGTTIEVIIKDLMPKSSVKISCVCDNPNCNNPQKIYEVVFYDLQRSLNKNYGNYFCYTCSLTRNDRINKIKEKRKNQIMPKGEKHPNWNNLLTEIERKRQHSVSGINKWKKEVLKRDNYNCQKCHSKEHLCVHHINNFANFKEQRTDVDNGITLCKDCHKDIHSKFGMFTVKENLISYIGRVR